MRKKKIIRNENNGQTNIFVVPFVVIRCYSLSLVVALVDNRFYSLSLDVLLVCLFLSDSFSTVLSSPSFVCSFIFHGLTSKVAVFERSFFDLNNLMRILWNNMKMFWYYSYENKWMISRKFARLTFFGIIRSAPTNNIMDTWLRVFKSSLS